MNTLKRILAVGLTLLMALPLFPVLAAAEDMAYTESVVDFPEGYSDFTGLFALPDGSVAMAARDEGGQWNMLVYSDLNAAPNAVPIAFEGNMLQKIESATDGSIAAMSMELPGLRGGGPSQEGEAPVVRQSSGDVVSQESDVPAVRQSSEGENAQVGTKSQGGKVMMRGGDMKSIITWFAPDGSVQSSFSIDEMPMSIAALPGRRLAALTMGAGIVVYDESGKPIQDVGGNMLIGIVADAHALYAISGDNKIALYDVNTLQPVETVDLPGEFALRTAATSLGAVYLIDSTGLYKLNGASLDKIIDGVGTYFGDPSNGVTSLVVLEDGTVAALIEEGAGGYGGGRVSIHVGGESAVKILAVYSPADPATMASRKTFTITALRESASLLKAVTDFQRSHPELKVVLDAKMSENDESPVDDAIRTLNTDLLAGKGGDVLILDGLPIQKYIEKGILADLTQVLSGIDFLPGIREGSNAADGKLYAMPSRFSFDTLWGNAEAVAKLSSLSELINTPLESGQTILNPRSPEDWLSLFYPASEGAFRDEGGKVSFDSPAFEEFLDLLYGLYAEQGEDPSETMEFARGGISRAALQAMINGSTALYPSTVSDLMTLTVAYTISGGKDSGFTTVPSLDGLSRCYKPALLVGVNERSENPEAAREFALSMFGAEVQELSDPTTGLPVVAGSLDKQIDEAIERSKAENIMQMISMDGGNPIQMEQPDENTLLALRSLCDELSVPATVDDTLLSFIVDETASFFNGQGNAQSAAQAVQQRAWSYLNE